MFNLLEPLKKIYDTKIVPTQRSTAVMVPELRLEVHGSTLSLKIE